MYANSNYKAFSYYLLSLECLLFVRLPRNCKHALSTVFVVAHTRLTAAHVHCVLRRTCDNSVIDHLNMQATSNAWRHASSRETWISWRAPRTCLPSHSVARMKTYIPVHRCSIHANEWRATCCQGTSCNSCISGQIFYKNSCLSVIHITCILFLHIYLFVLWVNKNKLDNTAKRCGIMAVLHITYDIWPWTMTMITNLAKECKNEKHKNNLTQSSQRTKNEI